MKKSEFLAMVQVELDTIKAKATKGEIDRLNFVGFEVNSEYGCIYGQMTGNCESDRAKELYPKTFKNVCFNRKKLSFSYQSFKKGERLTALEKYLYMVDENQHLRIIQYLKNEIETISL